MSANTSPSEAVLARAAELRATGNSWEAVAAQMHRSVSTIRKWPNLYAERWHAALRAAERRLLADAGAESVLVLRQLLRSDDEKVRRDAAKFLIDLRLEQAKLDPPATSSAPPSDIQLFAAFLEGLTDEQLEQLAADLRNAPPAQEGAGNGEPRHGAD
jgi:hypothetical protein